MDYRKSAAAKMSRGTQSFTPWDPSTGQLDMSLYEYAIRHPGIKNLAVLRDKHHGAMAGGDKYQIPSGGPNMLSMEPGQVVRQRTIPRIPVPGENGTGPSVSLPGPDAPPAVTPLPGGRGPGTAGAKPPIAHTFAAFNAKAGKNWSMQEKQAAYRRMTQKQNH